ncbi:MAG: radical SAM family heme chaperone HemW [Candidatus Dormibacteria bacterium]
MRKSRFPLAAPLPLVGEYTPIQLGSRENGVTQCRALYIHIPFCEHRCAYCDFTAIGGMARAKEYMEALRTEIALWAGAVGSCELDSIFIGGGTPSFVDPQEISTLLDVCRTSFAFASDIEITMEANPSSTTYERAAIWRDSGVNRLSMGIQSFDDAVLRKLGRVHSADRAREAYEAVRRVGFQSVNGDFIGGVWGSSREVWSASLAEAIRLGFDHLSCYELIVEESTPLYGSVHRGEVVLRSEEDLTREAEETKEQLTAAGYEQYEVSNFAKPGHRCRHNLVYWQGGAYLACGVGSHGYLTRDGAEVIGSPPQNSPGCRFWHVEGIGAYIDALKNRTIPLRGWEWITAQEQWMELIMLQLRCPEGVSMELLEPTVVAPFVDQGLLAYRDARVVPTSRGLLVLNGIVEQLVDHPPCTVANA